MSLSMAGLRKTSRLGLLVFAGAVAIALLVTSASGDTQNKTVESRGTEDFRPNVRIFSTLHFHPGKTNIDSGGTLTFTHADDTDEPHTLSIVDEADLPTEFEQIFECGAPGTVCDEVDQLFPPGPPPPDGFIDAPGTGEGIDGRLDTLFVEPGGSASAEVTAEPGTTLHYFCVIHPWMQGEINVK